LSWPGRTYRAECQRGLACDAAAVNVIARNIEAKNRLRLIVALLSEALPLYCKGDAQRGAISEESGRHFE
jgi:hypothetical protein